MTIGGIGDFNDKDEISTRYAVCSACQKACNPLTAENPEYWVCIIGPTVRSKLPKGADFPLRTAVRSAFEQMAGEEDKNCWSGWGCGETKKEAIMKVWNEEQDDDFHLRSKEPSTAGEGKDSHRRKASSSLSPADHINHTVKMVPPSVGNDAEMEKLLLRMESSKPWYGYPKAHFVRVLAYIRHLQSSNTMLEQEQIKIMEEHNAIESRYLHETEQREAVIETLRDEKLRLQNIVTDGLEERTRMRNALETTSTCELCGGCADRAQRILSSPS